MSTLGLGHAEVNPAPCPGLGIADLDGIGRPDTINEHLIGLLLALNLLDFVLPTRPDRVATPSANEAHAGCWLYYFGHEDEPAEAIGAGGPTIERTLTYQIALEVRSDDEWTRLRRLSRLDAVIRNTLETASPNGLYRLGSLRVGTGRHVAAVAEPRARILAPITLHARFAGAALRPEDDRESEPQPG